MKQTTKSFHNTPDLFSKVLEKADKKATRQEDLVLEMFKRLPLPKTAEEVIEIMKPMHESSVRRSLSNLSNPKKQWKAALLKTTISKEGKWGIMVKHWKLNEPTN
jgi:hypothetical protein